MCLTYHESIYLITLSHWQKNHILFTGLKFLLLYLSSSQCSWAETEQELLPTDQMQPLGRTQSGSSGASLNLCGQINERLKHASVYAIAYALINSLKNFLSATRYRSTWALCSIQLTMLY